MSYELDAVVRGDGEFVVVRGAVAPLGDVPGVNLGRELAVLRATRLNFLIVEVLASPTAVSDAYRRARGRALNVGYDRNLAEDALCRVGEGALCERLLPHQRELLAFAGPRRHVFNASEQGCIAGESVIQVNRAGRGFKIPLRLLYQKFNGPPVERYRSWDHAVPTTCRALILEDGELHQRRIKAVVYSGIKSVLKLTLSSGKSVRLTPYHLVITPQHEWVRADSLVPGDRILSNGRRSPGTVSVGGLHNHPRADGRGKVLKHILIMEKMIGRLLTLEEVVHHKDGDHWNNDPKNLQLCANQSEHAALHAAMPGKGAVKFHGTRHAYFVPEIDEVISVVPDGEADVYDIEMDAPDHNFVADSIIVHNTGKTLMTLASATTWGSQRVLVVCPKSVAGEWAAAVRTLGQPWEVTDLTDGALSDRLRRLVSQERLGYLRHLVLVNYDVLKKLRAALAAWRADLLVFDESWQLKTPSAGRTRAAHWLTDARRAPAGQRRVLLAGTPVGNHAGDLWAQLRTLDRGLAPETCGRFLEQFCHVELEHTPYGVVRKPHGVRDPVGLLRRLEPVWFRATKEGCLRLPPKVRRVVALELTPAQWALYRRVQADGDAALGNELALTPPAVRALRLQQVTGGHRPNPDVAGWRGCARLPCAKLCWLLGWAEDNLKPHPAVRTIVFCRFNAEVLRVQEGLVRLLGKDRAVGVTGDDGPFPLTAAELGTAKARFNEGGAPQVLVCQVARMAAGHNLQACDHVIYFSNDWSFILRAQSEDRAHRLGREREVQYWTLVAHGTVDEDIHSSLEDKRDFAGRVCVET